MSTTSTMTTTSYGKSAGSFPTVVNSPVPSSSSITLDATPSSSTTAPTLRSLYPRAARAFLQKDVALTHSLIVSAFSILHAPQTVPTDPLDSYRRKWDILRVTLETTVFYDPPKSSDPNAIPASLRSNLMMSAQSLLATMHARSLRLFTPTSTDLYPTPTAACLPPQILVALALSCMKLECPEIGRGMIEDWLSYRDLQPEHLRMDKDGYGKVLDLYCLHVLPGLHKWEDAKEFLRYESDLTPQARLRLTNTLELLQRHEIEAARSIPTPPMVSVSQTPSPARTPSPAPSNSSGSSVDTNDTHSTRTVVPRTQRQKQGMNGFSPLSTSASASSITTNEQTNGHANPKSPTSVSSSSTAHQRGGHASTSITVAHSRAVTARSKSPDFFSLIKTTLRPHLTTSKLVFAVLFVLVPLFSFIMRLRARKRLRLASASTPNSVSSAAGRGSLSGRSSNSVEEVKRRLGAAGGGSNAVITAWREVVRSVTDAVRMAGGGLV